MTSQRPTPKPAFFWQAGLILLPVLVMAVVALRSIITSRTEVEQQARQRAEEVARQYRQALEQLLGNSLRQHDLHSGDWCQYMAQVTGAWPGSKARAEMEGALGAGVARIPSYPGLPPEEVLPGSFGLTPDGRVGDSDSVSLAADGRVKNAYKLDPAPQPPTWFTALSPEQCAVWEALNSAAASGADVKEIEEWIDEFDYTGPEIEARLNAAFIGLRARLRTLPPAKAVDEALSFISNGTDLHIRHFDANGQFKSVTIQLHGIRDTLSAAGLPLSNLAFGEALRYARIAGPSEKLWFNIRDQVLHAPSPLIPSLLDQLQEVAGTNTALQAGVGAWRTLWHARLKLYDIADIVRQTRQLPGISPTSFWLDYNQTRWFCTLNPNRFASTNMMDVLFLPKPVVERTVEQVLQLADVKLPDYLGLAVLLEDEALTLPTHWSPARDSNLRPPMLTQTSGTLPMNLEETWRRFPLSPSEGERAGVRGPSLSGGSGAQSASNGRGGLSLISELQPAPGKPDIDQENLPSHPRFTLQVYLADPARLYASYRRQAGLLAGLVAVSAFAALIGVLASWRAFRRQLRLNELKSNFVSSVSHELRSPIASVRLMAESLERGKVSEAPKQQEYFRFIVQECRRLSALIENVLDFSRIEQGRKQYDFEPTDLVALAQQTVKLMETYAAERGVHLQLQLPDPQLSTLNPQPSADGKALQQALVNLIDNALKHSPKGGTVTVGLEVPSGREAGGSNQLSVISDQESSSGASPASRITHHVSRPPHHASRILLSVTDHGPGIPAAEHDKIFERFYRRGSELRRQTQGVGIGLSIVKHIIEAHGGKVLVRSAPGQGSRFTIELPASPADAKPE